MKFSNIANVVDCEHQEGRLIEVGLTMLNLKERKILKSYCMPVKVDFEISPEITALTGWTNRKLQRQGMPLEQIANMLINKHGFKNRLLLTDMSNEIQFLEEQLGAKFSDHRMNISILYAMKTGQMEKVSLEGMLATFGMTFEGSPHLGVDDSKNIARVGLVVMPQLPPEI
ncbi:MAG: hypothetical protein K2Y22_06205 [Candidatus Obscuribacterales bacterium]|nr:hypothetical protein [Candidatus Obscuribacterales bacterium]